MSRERPYPAVQANLAEVRPRWQRGDCLCCGGGPDDYADIYGSARAVAEGVMMCGECVRRGHDQDDVLPHLLGALLPVQDGEHFAG